MAKTEITEVEALQMAIDHFQQQALRNCGVMYGQYTAVANWLTELQGFKDETPITEEFLTQNGFEFKIGDKDDPDFYLFCDDVVEISATLHNEEAGEWKVEVTFLDHGDTQKLYIITIGQLRMFLAICGLDNIVEQFKE